MTAGNRRTRRLPSDREHPDARPRPARGAARRPDVAAVVVTVLAWASAFVAIRGVGEDLSPGALALGRLLIGTAVLGLLMLGRGWVRPQGREWALLAVCGIGWFGIYNVALNAAEQHLDAGTTAMLVNIGPILIAVFAGLLLGEGFPRWLVVGITVAFAGVVLIGLATRSAETDLVGVVLCVVAAVTYAAGVVAQKPLLRRLPGLQVTFMACAIGRACAACRGPARWSTTSAPRRRARSPGMVYLGAVPTALAFSTWAYALRRMDAGKLGVTTYLVPPLVILLGWLLLDEVPPVLAAGRRGRVPGRCGAVPPSRPRAAAGAGAAQEAGADGLTVRRRVPGGAMPPAGRPREDGHGRHHVPSREVSVQEQEWAQVVAAATRAPSIHNTQPWRFVARPGPARRPPRPGARAAGARPVAPSAGDQLRERDRVRGRGALGGRASTATSTCSPTTPTPTTWPPSR